MYLKLVVAYSVVFALFIGYAFYLQRQLSRLEDRIEDVTGGGGVQDRD